MADLLLWFLYSKALVLYFILHPAWGLSVDIMMNVISRGECVRPLVCKQGISGQEWSWSVIIIPNDLFALGRSVHSVEGDIVLLSSLSCGLTNCTQEHNSQKQDFDVCSINCSILFSKQRHAYLQSAHIFAKTGRQVLFDLLSPNNRHGNTMPQSISSILSSEKWKTHVLIASSYEVLTAVSSKMLSPTSKLLSFTMDNVSQLNGTLDSLYIQLDRKDLNFIVVCSATCIVEFLNQVYQFETMARKISNRWLLIPTEGFVGDIVNSSLHVPTADIVVMEKTPHVQELHVLSWSEIRNLLSSLDTTDPLITHAKFADYIDQTKQLTNPSAIANVHVLNAQQKEKMIRHVGHISEDGDVVVSEDLFPGFKYGFRNRTLTVSTLEWPPFVFKRDENGSIIYYGMCIDILQELSRGLNFSYSIVEPEDQEWGGELDGRWTGLVGEMAYKKADLLVAPLAIMESRERVMDFTVPYFYVQSVIIMTKQDSNANKWKTLVVLFRYEVLICILISLIFSTVFIFVVEEIHPVNGWLDNRLSVRRMRYGDILWYHFGSLMANGGAYLPSSQAGRSVLGCWWLFTVLTAAVYSGNLIAFLTDWRNNPPFSTLEEMVEQDTYKWGTMGGTAYIDLFKNSNETVYKTIWRGMQSDSEQTTLDMDVHVSKVLGGEYAYLGEETMVQLWKPKQCDLHVIYDPFYLMNYAIGLPNNSVYTSLFSEQVLRINELGLPRQWFKKWRSSFQCEASRPAKRVDLLALQSAFYAAGVGVLLAISVLMTEIMYNRKHRESTLSNTEKYACETESGL